MESATTLYVTEQGAHLHRVGGRLLVRDRHGGVLKDMPVFRLERVMLFGNIEVTTQAFLFLADNEIDLVYLTQEGRFRCRAIGLRLEDARLRQQQCRLSESLPRRLELARGLVAAKISNGRAMLRRRAGAEGEGDAPLRARLKELANSALACDDLEKLRGIEGSAAVVHFEALRRKLAQDLGFERRQRRPPRDPVNAMLSFGYTLLYGQVLAAVIAAGLDPFQGVLHELSKGRPSLALDLMEELRPLVDGVVLALVNRVGVTARDFVSTEQEGVRMTPASLARFVAAFHERQAEQVHHQPSGRTVDYRDFCRLQAQSYRAWVQGEGSYEPLAWR